MHYKKSEVKTGIFISITLLVFFGFLFIIVGANSWTDKEKFQTRFKYVGGIEEGSMVRYSGLAVGKVVELRLPEDGDPRVEVVIEIKKNTPIRKNSQAFLTTIGIMGAFYIEITAGSPDSPRLPAGSLITSLDVTSFAQMSGPAANATDKLTELLGSTNDLLNEENRRNISSMIKSMDEMLKISTTNMQVLSKNLNQLSIELRTSVVSFNNLMAQNDSSITQSMNNLHQLIDQSNSTVKNVEKLVQTVDHSISSNEPAYIEVMDNLITLSRNLEDFSQTIKDKPWTLVRKSAPPKREIK